MYKGTLQKKTRSPLYIEYYTSDINIDRLQYTW